MKGGGLRARRRFSRASRLCGLFVTCVLFSAAAESRIFRRRAPLLPAAVRVFVEDLSNERSQSELCATDQRQPQSERVVRGRSPLIEKVLPLYVAGAAGFVAGRSQGGAAPIRDDRLVSPSILHTSRASTRPVLSRRAPLEAHHRHRIGQGVDETPSTTRSQQAMIRPHGPRSAADRSGVFTGVIHCVLDP